MRGTGVQYRHLFCLDVPVTELLVILTWAGPAVALIFVVVNFSGSAFVFCSGTTFLVRMAQEIIISLYLIINIDVDFDFLIFNV